MATTTGAAQQSAVAVIDSIEDESGRRVTVAPLDGRVCVRGWALDEAAAAFDRVEIGVGGARASSAFAQRRPDVAAIFGSPEDVGFRAELELAGASLGHHVLALAGVRADGTRVAIPVSASLDVVAPLRAVLGGLRAGAMQGAVDEVRAESGTRRTEGGAELVGVDAMLLVLGWAASPAKVPASLAYAEIDGGRVFRGMAGHGRPDVATALGTEYAGYGFRIRIPAHELGIGEHTLRVFAAAEDSAGTVGEPVRVVVDARRSALLAQRGHRVRGRIDLVGRLGEDKHLREERTHLRLSASERAVLTGWSGDPESGALPDRLVLAVDGFAHGTVQRGIERDDVVTSTVCPALRRSGFSAVIRASALGAGFHRAELVAFYGDEPIVLDALSFEVTT